jgi:hypothetical protein
MNAADPIAFDVASRGHYGEVVSLVFATSQRRVPFGFSILELYIGFGVNRTMKDEDASRIAISLERIAAGLNQLNDLLQRKAQASKTRIPNWAWAVGISGVGLFIWSVLKT